MNNKVFSYISSEIVRLNAANESNAMMEIVNIGTTSLCNIKQDKRVLQEVSDQMVKTIDF